MLRKGCGINQTARDKCSLLSDVASSNNEDVIDFLLENRIDKSYLSSSTCWAIIHGCADAVKLLLNKGADLDAMYASCKGLEKGLYHITATREGREDMIRLLASAGVDFKKTPNRAIVIGLDKTNLSPLDFAKKQFGKWPDATYIADNIKTIEETYSIGR